MACRLFGAKPLFEPMLVYCYLGSWEHSSAKFQSKFKLFIRENAFQNVVWKIATILSLPHCVNNQKVSNTYILLRSWVAVRNIGFIFSTIFMDLGGYLNLKGFMCTWVYLYKSLLILQLSFTFIDQTLHIYPFHKTLLHRQTYFISYIPSPICV